MSSSLPGRFTKAAIHAEAGELEVRLSAAGNWQLYVRAGTDCEWRLACSGDLDAGAEVPQGFFGTEPVRIGNLLLDRAARRVCVDGAEVPLTALQYDVLALLARDPQRVVSKQELAREVWGSELQICNRTIDSHVSRLRCKLRHAGAAGFVVNCWGVGYKLCEGAPPAAPTA